MNGRDYETSTTFVSPVRLMALGFPAGLLQIQCLVAKKALELMQDGAVQEENWTLEGLFKDQPAGLKLYYGVEQYIKSLGDVEISVTKTRVSFGVRTKFTWVWLRQLWTKNRPEDSITLTFEVDHQMSDHRIVEAVRPGPGRWTHHVIIEQEADLDKVVKVWLAQACEFGKIDRRKRHTTTD